MCFNGQKSWQLGWYLGNTLVVDGKVLKMNSYSLVGVSDYSLMYPWQLNIIKVINSRDGFDYYLAFNRQSGVNSGTMNGGDQVLITKHMVGSFYGDSILVARLNNDQVFNVAGFKGERSLSIWAHIYMDRSPPFANVFMFENIAPCSSDQDCNDSNSCTIDSCVSFGVGGGGYCMYSEMDCSICGAMVTVETMTNGYPENFHWNVLNEQTGKVILSSTYTDQANFKDSSSQCLQYGQYKFVISYPESKNVTTGINFTLHVGEELINYGTIFDMEEEETMFIICSSMSNIVP